MSTAPAEPDISPVPDGSGHFGVYGGLFAPESLMAAIAQGDVEAKRRIRDFLAKRTPKVKEPD